MSEIEMVMNALLEAKKAGRKAALATVIRVKGSAYRREGAKMLIDENENRVGMISGGCLENDVAELAKSVIKSGIPLLKEYDLDEDHVWGLGLGCPGEVEIYIEPIYKDKQVGFSPFTEWVGSFIEKKESVLATVLEDGLDSKRFFLSRDCFYGDLGDKELNTLVRELAWKKLSETNPKAETMSIYLSDGKQVRVFVDIHLPPFELMVFGAGHDAIPVVQFATASGFQTTVVDQRETYNNEARFPNSIRYLLKPSQFKDHLTINHRTYVIVMNHHRERDEETLKFVLQSEAPYIGVLGPHSRMKRMIETLSEDDFIIDERQFEKIHNPVGLDIGAVTSEEIAISILAEIIAKKNGHQGGFLKGSDIIHHKNMSTELKLV